MTPAEIRVLHNLVGVVDRVTQEGKCIFCEAGPLDDHTDECPAMAAEEAGKELLRTYEHALMGR